MFWLNIRTFYLLSVFRLLLLNFGICQLNLGGNSIAKSDDEEIVTARELAKESWIHSIKDRLLQKLGLEEDQLPNVTQRINLPITLEQEIESQYYTQADASYRNVKKSERKLDIFSAECTTHGQTSDDIPFKIHFNLDSPNRLNSFDSATVILKKIAAPPGLQFHKLRIILYHVLGISRNGTVKKEMVESRGVASSYNNDLVFVVTSAMLHWSKRKKSNVEFEVVVESISGQHVNPWWVLQGRDCAATETICNGTVQILQLENGSLCQPVLIIWAYPLMAPPPDRRKRAHIQIEPKSISCRKDARGNLLTDDCCLNELVIDFREIGWSTWIVAPLSFTTGSCVNDCTNKNKTNYELQKWFEPKCIPIQKDLQLLYYKGDNSSELLIKTLPNFRTIGCKCSI